MWVRFVVAAVAVIAGSLAVGRAPAVEAQVPPKGMGATPPTAVTAAVNPPASTLASLPASVDLKPWAVGPGDQGTIGSCVPWAIDYAMLGWYWNHDGHAGKPYERFAPMYAYSQLHLIEPPGGSSTGETLNMLVTQGAALKSQYPWGDQDYTHQPTAAEKANANFHKISGYKNLFGDMNGNQGVAASNMIKAQLAANRPVAILFKPRAKFRDLTSTNPVDDDVTSAFIGNHEVLAVGYNATGILVQNSWGTGWGQGGFGWLAWNVVEKDVMGADVIFGFGSSPQLDGALYPNGRAMVVKTSTSGDTTSDPKWVHAMWRNETTGQWGPYWGTLGPQAPAGVTWAGKPAAVRNTLITTTPNNLEVFVVGDDAQMYHSSQQANGAFSSWTVFGSGSKFAPGVAAANNPDGRIEVVATRLNDKAPMHSWQPVSGTPTSWSAWATLGSAIAPADSSLSLVAKPGTGGLEAFATDDDGTTYHIWQDSNMPSGWNGWWSVPGSLRGTEILRKEIPDDPLAGTLELFGIGQDGKMYHQWQVPGSQTGWSALVPMPGTTPPLNGMVTGITNPSTGTLEVFATDASTGAILHIWQKPGTQTGWSDWTPF